MIIFVPRASKSSLNIKIHQEDNRCKASTLQQMASLLQLRIVRCNVCICMFARVRFTKQRLSKQATETATALVVQAKTSLEGFYNTENLLDVWIWSSKSVTNVPLSHYIKAANQIMSFLAQKKKRKSVKLVAFSLPLRNIFIYKAEFSLCF